MLLHVLSLRVQYANFRASLEPPAPLRGCRRGTVPRRGVSGNSASTAWFKPQVCHMQSSGELIRH